MSGLSLIAMFGAGLASFLSPCVLPLVPVWAGLSLSSTNESSQTLRSTLPFVVGLALTFTTLGALSGAFGGLVGQSAQWIPRVGGILICVFGLMLVRSGGWLGQREIRLLSVLPERAAVPSSIRSVLAGISVGAAWTPCVGPLLGSALALAATTGGAVRGGTLLGVYTLGIAAPFIAVALALDSWPHLTRWLSGKARGLQVVGGWILMVVGTAMATGITSRLIEPAARLISSR